MAFSVSQLLEEASRSSPVKPIGYSLSYIKDLLVWREGHRLRPPVELSEADSDIDRYYYEVKKEYIRYIERCLREAAQQDDEAGHLATAELL